MAFTPNRSVAACAALVAIAHASSLRGSWSEANTASLWGGSAQTPEPTPEPESFSWGDFDAADDTAAQSTSPWSASASAPASAWGASSAPVHNTNVNGHAWSSGHTTHTDMATVTPFNCSGIGSMPIQVMAKNDQDKEQGYDVRALDFITGHYTTLYTIPMAHIRVINSAAINPIDGIAYATAVSNDGFFFFVRFDAHRVEFVAALDGFERSFTFTAAFTPSGDYVLPDNGRGRLFIFGANVVANAPGHSDPADAAIPRWTRTAEERPVGVREIALTDARTGKPFTVRGADIAILESDALGASATTAATGGAVSARESLPVVIPPTTTLPVLPAATRTYAVDVSSNTGKVNIINLESGKAWTLVASKQDSPDFVNQKTKWHGAAWNFGGDLYFANNGGGGVFRLVQQSIDLAKGTVKMAKAGLSDASKSNDGMNCWAAGGTDPFKQPTPAPTPISTLPLEEGDDTTGAGPGGEDDDQEGDGVCSLPAETGKCRALFRMWYFSHAEGSCKPFVWGGCGGNGNRFESQLQCESRCKHDGDDSDDGNDDGSQEKPNKPCKQRRAELKQKVRELRAQGEAARALLKQKRELLGVKRQALKQAQKKNRQIRAQVSIKAEEVEGLQKGIKQLKQAKDLAIRKLKKQVSEKKALIQQLKAQLRQK